MSENKQGDTNQSPITHFDGDDANFSPEAPQKRTPPFYFNEHLRRYACEEERRRPASCEIIFWQSAYQRIVEHLKRDTSREYGGILLGYESKAPDGLSPVVAVVCAIPAEHTRGDLINLTFTEETWLDLQLKTDIVENNGALKLKRVGWYHSHPGHGIFLSQYDIDVCSNFSRPHQLALVVDPVKDLGGFFVRDEKGYHPRDPQGFWEFPNIEKSSVITWRNMEELKQRDAAEKAQSAQGVSSGPLKIGRPKSPGEPPQTEGVKEKPSPSEILYASAALAQLPAPKPLNEKGSFSFWDMKWLATVTFVWPLLLFGLFWLSLDSQLNEQARALKSQGETIARLQKMLNETNNKLVPSESPDSPGSSGREAVASGGEGAVSPTPSVAATPGPTQSPVDSTQRNTKVSNNPRPAKTTTSKKENKVPKAVAPGAPQGFPGSSPIKSIGDPPPPPPPRVPPTPKPSGGVPAPSGPAQKEDGTKKPEDKEKEE